MPADKGYLNKAYGAGRWLKKKFYGEGEKEKSILTPLSTDEMVKRSLLVYLEPFQKVLLQPEEYPGNFVKMLVKEVRDLYRQHREPLVKHPLMRESTKVPVPSVTEVSIHVFIVQRSINYCNLACICHVYTRDPLSFYHSLSV